MTVPGTENTVAEAKPQEKVDTILAQNQADTKLQQPVSQLKPDESQEDPNWKAFRESRKKDREERVAAEKRASEKEAEAAALKAALEVAFNKSPTPPFGQGYNTQAYPSEETEDERIEKKVQAAIAAREAAAEQSRIQREQQEYPQRLQQTYSDFHQTISSENMDYLDYHYPEVTNPLKRLPDGYEKWADIYKAIKKFVPNNATAKKEAARAESNFAKPKSMSGSSVMQPGDAVGSARLSEDRKAENWARMQRTLKGIG